MWAQGDDLSVITDDGESGFRVIEYGKSRKVALPDSLKREIEETKLQRELRRRKIGQHTIETALRARVRVGTYRKILAAIEEYKREKYKSGRSCSQRAQIDANASLRPIRVAESHLRMSKEL